MSMPDVHDTCGWLDPNGRYHETGFGSHDRFFDDMEISVNTAEEFGWIHLDSGCYSHFGTGLHSRLTVEQRNWLSRVGFELRKGDD